MMKKYTFLFISIMLMVVCTSFTPSPMSDEGSDSKASLENTSWQIVAVDDSDEAESLVGITMTFNTNGTVKSIDSSATSGNESRAWAYGTWTYNNGKLKLIVGEEGPDDYMEGSFTINNNTATFNYHWADVDGKWTESVYHTMQLKRLDGSTVISVLYSPAMGKDIRIYNLNGQILNGLGHGLNIIKFGDGTSKKIMRK